MYRRRYGRPRGVCVPFRKRKVGRKKGNCKKSPFYGKCRRRPRACHRDWDLWCKGRGMNPEQTPVGAVPESDSEEEEVEEVKDLEKELHVKSVDLLIDDNSESHHTSKYGCTKSRTRKVDGKNEEFPAELVIRRGFPFKMTITFDRPYDIEKNDITLSFCMDDDPKTNPQLQPSFKVDETGKKKYKKKWGASLVEKKGNSLTINVFVPASAPIGEWEFSIRTAAEVKGKDTLYKQYNHDEDINIICNPWCPEDIVYMADEVWRNETVLNDYGVQYRGSYSTMGVKPWFFGQFEDGILDAAFHLVRKGFDASACPAMGNPVKVVRIVSQIVNDLDDSGVLTGNWSGEYEGGVSPGDWCGSVRILHKYMDTGKPVKYGQCWVFSALVTTVCRALGIPCRSVTNFQSAHNTDMERLSIDKFTKGSEESGNDSVWNFHVWNEVWMRRLDLSPKKEWDGWQVIDATPQELSGGVFCCGPAPVKAIKEGELKVGHDTAFIFAEVNADKAWFIYDKLTDTMKEITFLRKTDAVGKFVSTHKPTGDAFAGSLGSDDADRDTRLERLDLTDEYKYKEGSDKEREIVKKAEKMFKVMNAGVVAISDDEEDEEEDDDTPISQEPPIAIEIEKPLPSYVGNPFSFKVKVTNAGSETIAIKDVICKVLYKTYDDQVKGRAAIKKEKDIKLDAGENKVYTVTVDEDKACARPQDGFLFDLVARVSFYDGKVIRKDVDYRLRRPDVIVKGPAKCKLGETVKIDLSFTNPLKVDLTDCKVIIDGGFDLDNLEDDTIKIAKIDSKKTWSQSITATPRRHPHGQKYRALNVNFKSKQLEEIDGFLRVQIEDK